MKTLLLLLLVVGCTCTAGCAINPALAEEQLRVDNATMALPHPRALLMARVLPACIFWCRSDIIVTSSEGVRAAGTQGDLTANESSTVSQQIGGDTLAPTIPKVRP
jgi:hypothetical protein